MTSKDFWRESKVAVLGAGSWGTVLANLAAPHAGSVKLWFRDEERARLANATRTNAEYFPDLALHKSIVAVSEVERAFEGGVDAILWVVPSSGSRALARKIAPLLRGHEILIHATKGIEEGTLKRVSEVLGEELPLARIGSVSGPNLAAEIAKGLPAATIVASRFQEVIDAGIALLTNPRFQVEGSHDLVGVEWAGTLKNVLAIAAGCFEALGLGWNARAMLLVRGLEEMMRVGKTLGAKPETFLGLSGLGDLIATASSPLSRNYRVGFRLAKGEKLEAILEDLDTAAEGVRTAMTIADYATSQSLRLPITQAVRGLVAEGWDGERFLGHLLT